MSYTNGLDKPTDYFNTKLYTGNGTDAHAITGVGFQPDWVWVKERSTAQDHNLFDSVRGAGSTKGLISNNTSAEGIDSVQYGYISSFDSDGFTLADGSDGSFPNARMNDNGAEYVAWNWLTGVTASSNTDGSITSSVSANTTAGFSIVSFTGTGSNATVGHGLNAVPKMIITKKRSSADNWYTYHASIGATKVVYLDLTTASETYSTNWNDTEPTSSVFSLGTAGTNSSGSTYIAYCFAEKKGYSKIGSYTGNGNSDGTFVYTGFKPAWLLIKRTEASAKWFLWDNKREPFNLMDSVMVPSASESENTDPAFYMDFLSNGFKLRNTFGDLTASGEKFIYMAFAESPFVTSTGIPTTAR
jgi:hypothetical protein